MGKGECDTVHSFDYCIDVAHYVCSTHYRGVQQAAKLDATMAGGKYNPSMQVFRTIQSSLKYQIFGLTLVFNDFNLTRHRIYSFCHRKCTSYLVQESDSVSWTRAHLLLYE